MNDRRMPAWITASSKDKEDSIKWADKALYQAKEGGRNQVSQTNGNRITVEPQTAG